MDPARARFQDFVVDREIRPDTADDLYGVLTSSKVVLVLDDRCGGIAVCVCVCVCVCVLCVVCGVWCVVYRLFLCVCL